MKLTFKTHHHLNTVEDVFGFIAAGLDAGTPLQDLLISTPAHAGFKRLT